MVKLILTILIAATAAVYDCRTRRIPNFITLPAMFIGLVLNSYYSGFSGLGQSLSGLLLGGLLLLIPFVLGGMGAGDVKLLAAVGALNGPRFVIFTFIYGAFAGGAMALLVLFLRGRTKTVLNNLAFSLITPGQGLVKSNLGIPYGIAIFIGTLVTWYVGGR